MVAKDAKQNHLEDPERTTNDGDKKAEGNSKEDWIGEKANVANPVEVVDVDKEEDVAENNDYPVEAKT